MIIYKITNTINNKSYIGQTIQKIENRWYDHCKKKKYKSIISLAIEKYGKNNFTIEILEKCNDFNELDQKEEYWINFYKTLYPLGYNIKTGGQKYNKNTQFLNDKMRKMFSLEALSKISEASKNNWKNQEYRKHISNKRKEMWKDSEYREKMSLIRKQAHKNPIIKQKIIKGLLKLSENKKCPVIAENKITGEILKFNSLMDAERSEYNFKQSQISKCIKYEFKKYSHKGYFWKKYIKD